MIALLLLPIILFVWAASMTKDMVEG